MEGLEFINISFELDQAGLVWYPEIGDEVSERTNLEKVSILVDPQGLTPIELRENFVWLPTTEQLVRQFEARQALIYHAGITERLIYEAVIRTQEGMIETEAPTLRLAFGQALQAMLSDCEVAPLH